MRVKAFPNCQGFMRCDIGHHFGSITESHFDKILFSHSCADFSEWFIGHSGSTYWTKKQGICDKKGYHMELYPYQHGSSTDLRILRCCYFEDISGYYTRQIPKDMHTLLLVAILSRLDYCITIISSKL